MKFLDGSLLWVLLNFMVNLEEPHLDDLFNALASRPRRQVLSMVAIRSRTMTELALPLGLSLPALHKHLRVLERARLVEGRKVGREREVTFQPGALTEVEGWISFHRDFWNQQLDSVETFIREQKEGQARGDDR